MVPKGWVKQTFKNLLSSGDIIGIQDGNHGNDHPKSADYVESGIPFVMARDLKRGTIDFNNCSYITKSQADSLRIGFAKTGDVLLSHKGTIGEVAIVPKGYEYVMLTPQVTYYRLNPSGCLYYEYLFHYFLGDKYQSIFKTLATQSTRSYLGITAQKELEIDVPPLAEQIIIAKILSTWDQAISTTEQLLANSQRQKKALMQQLLTGKKRLLDKNGVRFSGEWKHNTLGKIAQVYQPKTISQSDLTTAGYPVYGANGIIGFFSDFNHENEQIAVTCRGSTCGVVNWTKPKSWITGNAMVVNVDNNSEVDKKFIYYVLCGCNLTYLISGSGQPQITGNIKNHLINIPTLDEQQKIASVLSAADEEIVTLRRKLDCLKQEKKALMQQLLTGKRRVQVN